MEQSDSQFEGHAIQYLTEVGWVPLPWFQWYQRLELAYLCSLPNLPSRTLIDAGAGWGRPLPELAQRVKGVVAVELANDMLRVLEKHANAYPNVTVVRGDYTRLDELLESLPGVNINSPLIVCLQNTLGTTAGDMWKALASMKKVAESKKGDIVLSLFNAEALETAGLELYLHLAPLVGDVDRESIDTALGVFVSKTGYRSQWFGSELRQRIKGELGGSLVTELKAPQFTILHVAYL